MRLPLKIAILRSGRTQRAISLDTGIPETRLSQLVRGHVPPTPAERDALYRVLHRDYFEDDDPRPFVSGSRRRGEDDAA
jgi:hypothetical protein